MLNLINSAASLSTSQSKLQAALQVLSSGSKINSAADNPAGMAQSILQRQLPAMPQAMNNIQQGISLLDTAGGAYDQINQGLQDIGTLTVQAGDGPQRRRPPSHSKPDRSGRPRHRPDRQQHPVQRQNIRHGQRQQPNGAKRPDRRRHPNRKPRQLHQRLARHIRHRRHHRWVDQRPHQPRRRQQDQR